MKAQLAITLSTNDAAIHDDARGEVGNIFSQYDIEHKFANLVERATHSDLQEQRSFDVKDTNGNTVGQYKLSLTND